ncbi:MAG TPA: YraN family protein [Thermoanaerobaculia bacterium]|nr:YraN family protein [Thermoanaerobaculia bacterium]
MRGLGGFSRRRDPGGRGKVGEAAARGWLASRGYRIVETNVRNHGGEIDVVAWDGDTLCFVEVKARASALYGLAVEAVDWRKRRRLVRAANLYLTRVPEGTPCRFDVLALDRGAGGEWEATLVRDAFQAE